VKEPSPVLVVAATCTPIDEVPVPRTVEYEPGDALSFAWLNGSVVAVGSVPISPTVGRIGRSPAMLQPAPETWVTLSPIVAESL
jgi:hypothetical protein